MARLSDFLIHKDTIYNDRSEILTPRWSIVATTLTAPKENLEAIKLCLDSVIKLPT